MNEGALLKSESLEFRTQYANKMEEVVLHLEQVLTANITQCQDTFKNFYTYGNHKSKSEGEIVSSFKSDFEKMCIVETFNGYMKAEIPQFSPSWLISDFTSPAEGLDVSFTRNSTKYLPFTDSNEQNRTKTRPTLRRIEVGKGGNRVQEEVQDQEYLDKKCLETDFYKLLKIDIDKILLKAWDGEEALVDDELRKFRQIMRYKQGQELFVHLLN